MAATQALKKMTDHANTVAIVSVRNLRRQAANCTLFEFEDHISTLHTTQIFSPDNEHKVSRKAYRFVKRFSDSNRLAHSLSRYPANSTIDKNCSLIIVFADNPYQLHLLNEIAEWRDHPAKKACYLSELWPGNLRDNVVLREPFKDFDHIFVGLSQALPLFRETFGVSCSYLPLGVDSLLFSRYENRIQRSIDMAYLGRREDAIHNELLKMSNQQDLFYLFDTVSGIGVVDHKVHRRMYSSLLARSKFTFAFPAKKSLGSYTDNVDEIGTRYFEFVAAGSVILGERPKNEHFEEYFGWEDAVIEITPENTAATIQELMRDPDRMNRIATLNTKNALEKHDWVYRWLEILKRFSIKPDTRVNDRIAELRAAAQRGKN